MSLISDALKEAQRERSGRTADRGASSSADPVFPYPTREKRRRPNWFFIGGIAGALVIAIVAALVVGGRSSSRRPSPTATTGIVSPNAAPIAANPTPVNTARIPDSSSVVAQSPAPTRRSAVAPTTPANQDRGASSTPSSVETARPPRRVETAPGQAPARPDSSVPARPPVAEPTTGAAVLQTTAGGSGVRVVVDPAGTRPADSLFKLAYAEQMRNNLDAARDLYERVIQMPQAPSEAFNDYGALLVQRGNIAAAAEMFRQAIKRNDRNVEAWVNLGDTHNASGHHADAMSAYSRASQLDPSRAAVKTRLAAEYELIGDTASARRLYEDAVKTSPNDPSAHHAYGSFLQSRRDYRGAIREFQTFVDLAPGQFPADVIAEIKRHITALRAIAP